MSWVNGNKKWTIPFVSLNNKSCRIDIYQRGYTGDTVTELSTQNPNAPGVAASDPFYYEEDDDEDLLKVIRTKTGYINLIETVHDGLLELHPTNNKELMVEVFYDNIIRFRGFIQAQDFSTDYVPCPREVSLPVMSPLATLEDINIPEVNPPKYVKLAQELADVLEVLNDNGSQFQSVVWPSVNNARMNGLISSLTVCPFNSDHTPAVADSKLFAPNTAQWLLESICNAYGWMAHEEPGVLIFTMFDHYGKYNGINGNTPEDFIVNLRGYTNVQELTFTGDTVLSLNNFMNISDNKGEESYVLPVNEVDMQYENEIVETAEFDFQHLTYVTTSQHSSTYVAWLKSLTPELTGPRLLDRNYLDASGKLTQTGTTACVVGSEEQKEMILTRFEPNVMLGGTIFVLKYYNLPTSVYVRFKYDLVWGNAIHSLGNEAVDHHNLEVIIKCGTTYYYGNGSWGPTPPVGGFPLNGSDIYISGVTDMPLEFYFSEASSQVGNKVELLGIANPRLERPKTLFAKYTEDDTKEDIIRNGNQQGSGVATINLGLNKYRIGTNEIDSNVMLSKFTEYPYLFETQSRLKVKCRQTQNSLSAQYYAIKNSFDSKIWRLIATAFHPWDDEWTLTLHRSSTLE